MQRLVLVSVCLVLAACERPALSRKPLLKAEASAPSLREGVWLFDGDAGCQFDRNAAASAWPDCVAWTLIAQGRIVRPGLWRKTRLTLASQPFTLTAGDPPLMQEPDGLHPGYYTYHAVRPLKTDPEGRVVEADTWTVVCPPSPEAGKPAPEIPGVRRAKDACYVADVEALSRLAGPGEGTHQVIRWLRDGDR